MSLETGLTPDKAVAVFGEPDRKMGNGLIIYEYDLEDGSKVRLGFPGSEKILYAKHVKRSGETEDVPLK